MARVPVIVRDNSGTTVLKSADAYITRPPNGQLSKDITNRDWVLECGHLEIFQGSNAAGTFDPNLVAMTVAGIPITGWADGEFVKWERAVDDFTQVIGTDGQPARARQLNKSGKITFTLRQDAIANDLLMQLEIADTIPSPA